MGTVLSRVLARESRKNRYWEKWRGCVLLSSRKSRQVFSAGGAASLISRGVASPASIVALSTHHESEVANFSSQE